MPDKDSVKSDKDPRITKPGNALVKYIGLKEDFVSFTRPKLKNPIKFVNNVAEVSQVLGQALVNTYPKTFKLLSEAATKPVDIPEV